MKKAIIALVLITTLIISGANAASGLVWTKKNPWQPGIKKEQVKDFNQQIKEKNKIIKKNQEIIKRTQFKVNNQANRLKSLIGKIKENPGALDADKLNMIKNTTANINKSHQELKATEGMLSENSKNLKVSNKNRNSQAFLDNLENIIAIQEKRISALKALLADMERLKKQLE